MVATAALAAACDRPNDDASTTRTTSATPYDKTSHANGNSTANDRSGTQSPQNDPAGAGAGTTGGAPSSTQPSSEVLPAGATEQTGTTGIDTGSHAAEQGRTTAGTQGATGSSGSGGSRGGNRDGGASFGGNNR